MHTTLITEHLILWYIGTAVAAYLYVRYLQLTFVHSTHKSHRTVAIQAWLRMSIAIGFLITTMLYLPLFHFILIMILFITTIWLSIWYISTRGGLDGRI